MSLYSYRFIFCLFSLRGVQALSDFPGPLATSNRRHKSLNEKRGEKTKFLKKWTKKEKQGCGKTFKILRSIIRLKWQVWTYKLLEVDKSNSKKYEMDLDTTYIILYLIPSWETDKRNDLSLSFGTTCCLLRRLRVISANATPLRPSDRFILICVCLNNTLD